MIKYKYKIIRYLPDRVSAEFVNIGLIIFNAEQKYLKARTISRIGRVKHLFPDVNSKTFIKKLKVLSKTINEIGERWKKEIEFDKIDNIKSVISSIMPNDDSSIVFSKEFTGIDLILDSAFKDLFDRMIIQHNEKTEKQTTDKEVWQKHYKAYFDKYQYIKDITSRSIKTAGDELLFEHAIKNGKWNFLEPVTFDLSRASNVKDKVYKWVGKLNELDSSNEKFNLYLLSILPQDKELKKFIKDRISNKKTNNFNVAIIEPKQANKLAKKLQSEINHS